MKLLAVMILALMACALAHGLDLKEMSGSAALERLFDENSKPTAELGRIIYIVNSRTSEAPSIIRNLFGNERINLHVSLAEKTVVLGIVTNDLSITRIEKMPVSSPTLNVFTDEETVKAIAMGENPLNEVQKALGNGKIRYEIVSPMASIGRVISSVMQSISIFFNNLLTGKFAFGVA